MPPTLRRLRRVFLHRLERIVPPRTAPPAPRHARRPSLDPAVVLVVAGSSLLLLFSGISSAAAAPSTTPVSCHITMLEGAVAPSECPEGSQIAVYKYRDGATLEGGFANSMPQPLFDSGSTSADLPPCGVWQADVVTPGPILQVIDATHQYSPDGRLLAHLEGDAGTCEIEATTTTQVAVTTTAPETPPTTAAAAPKLARTGKTIDLERTIAGLFLLIGGIFLASGTRLAQRRA